MSSLDSFKTALEGLILAGNRSKQNRLYDPLGTLIRLALLPLKPEGTKLNILNHKVTYRPPHAQPGYLLAYSVQDEFHWSHEDFHLLQEPIERAVRWFSQEPLAKKIFEMALSGLQILQKAYFKKSKEAHHVLHTFQTIITKGMMVENKNTDQSIEKFLQKLWSLEEIYAIYRLLVIAEQRSEEIKKEKRKAKTITSSLRSALSAIEVILQDKEAKLLRYLT